MPAQLRLATRADIPAMHVIRMAVKENVLTSTTITEADYVSALEVTGRGWVIDDGGALRGFAFGNRFSGNIWALFVHPDHERCGHGRRLHDTMVAWLFAQGLTRLNLGTEPGSRAQRFYETAGWAYQGLDAKGEASYVLDAAGRAPDPATLSR